MAMVVIDSDELLKLIRGGIKEELQALKPQVTIKEPEQIETCKSLAQMFSVTAETVSDWHKAGKITGFYMGNRLFFLRSSVMDEIRKINIKRSKHNSNGRGK